MHRPRPTKQLTEEEQKRVVVITIDKLKQQEQAQRNYRAKIYVPEIDKPISITIDGIHIC